MLRHVSGIAIHQKDDETWFYIVYMSDGEVLCQPFDDHSKGPEECFRQAMELGLSASIFETVTRVTSTNDPREVGHA